MRYFSMFSGIGGFERGIQEATQNWQCVGFCEVNKYAIQVYQSKFPSHVNYGDATRIIPADLPDFDFLCGGFPCQAFSVAGKRRGFEDTRGTLFFEIARILSVKRPKLLLLENVAGLLSHDKGRTFGTILATLSDLGYFCEWQVLNSKDFGVPQNRERVFIIGHLGGQGGRKVFPIAKDSEADIELPTLTARYWGGQANGGYLREITPNGTPQAERVYEPEGLSVSLSALGGGQGGKTGLYAVQDVRGINKKQNGTGIKKANESYTVDTLATQGISNGVRVRRLTPVECERLQGFPDGWTSELSDAQRYKCLGNAVTVNVITAIINRILWISNL